MNLHLSFYHKGARGQQPKAIVNELRQESESRPELPVLNISLDGVHPSRHLSSHLVLLEVMLGIGLTGVHGTPRKDRALLAT